VRSEILQILKCVSLCSTIVTTSLRREGKCLFEVFGMECFDLFYSGSLVKCLRALMDESEFCNSECVLGI